MDMRNLVQNAVKSVDDVDSFHLMAGVGNPWRNKNTGQRSGPNDPNALKKGTPEYESRWPSGGVSVRQERRDVPGGAPADVGIGELTKSVAGPSRIQGLLDKLGLSSKSPEVVYARAQASQERLTQYAVRNRRAGLAQEASKAYASQASQASSFSTKKRQAGAISKYYRKIAEAEARLRDNIKFEESSFAELIELDEHSEDSEMAKIVSSGYLDSVLAKELKKGEPKSSNNTTEVVIEKDESINKKRTA